MTPTSFTVHWSPAGGTPTPVYITQHRITGNQAWTANPAGTTAQTSQTISGLQPGTSYDVRVQASNPVGSAFSNVVQQTTLTAVGIVSRNITGGIEWTAAPVESAQGTSLTSTAGSINDATGARWTLVSGTGLQVNRNGVAAGSTANVILLLYFNHTVYEENNASVWQSWNGTAWVAATDPRVAPPTESPDGTTLTTTTGTITDTAGVAWTLVSGTGLQVARNGVVDASTTNTVTLLYFGHAVYRGNSIGSWFQFASGAWSPIPNDPRVQTILLGASNTITDSTGVVWGLATTNGGLATRNGVSDQTQGGVTELAYVVTTMWRNVGSTGLWWSWNGTTWSPPAGTLVSPIGPTRNPWDHPGSNASVWNTSIGAGATFGLGTDLDTIDISRGWNGTAYTAGPVGVVNVLPSYIGAAANGLYTFTTTGGNGRTLAPDNGTTLSAALHVPTGSTSPGTAAFFDPITQPARQYCFSGPPILAPGLQPGQGPFTETVGEWDDATGDNFGEDAETGLFGINIGAGLITGYDTDVTRNPVYPEIRHGLAFTTDPHLLKPNGTGITAPTAPESVQGALVTTVGPAIVDTSGERFTITSGGQVAVGGVADGTTNGVTTLLYWNHLVYQANVSSDWFSKANAAATWAGPVADPRGGVVPAVTVNPSSWPARVQDTQANANLYLGNLTVGATLAIPSTTAMPGGLNANQQGLFWTMQNYPSIFRGLSTGGFGYRCDQAANTSQWAIDARAVLPSLVALLRPMRNQHQAGQSFTTNPKNGPGTRSDEGPPPLTHSSAESVDGTEITSAGPVINASRTPGSSSNGPFDTFALTQFNGFIIRNGVTDTVTSANVVDLLYFGHKLYQKNQAGAWFVWSGTGYLASSDPRGSSGLAAPAQAAAAGFTTAVLNEDFTSASSVSSTPGAIASFYTRNPYGQASLTQGDLTFGTVGGASCMTFSKDLSGFGWGLGTTNAPVGSVPISTPSSHAVNTGNGRGFQYGYYEARICFDRSLLNGSLWWPAWWMTGDIFGSTPNGYIELDIVEFVNTSNGLPYSSIHEWNTPSQSGIRSPIVTDNPDISNVNFATPTTFNIFGMLWSTTGVTFYWNNVAGPTVPTTTTLSFEHDGTPIGSGTLASANTSVVQVGLGTGNGIPLSVDWVRIWQ